MNALETKNRNSEFVDQSPAVKKKVNASLATQQSKTETTLLKHDVLSQEQLVEKEELEKDLASGMKVSEAIGKWSTRLDTMDKWLTILPFVWDAASSSASLMFFIVQNQKLAKKYRLPRTDKFKAMMLQVWDWTVETLVKAPLNSLQAIPVLWWLTWPITQPLKVVTWYFADSIFKANKWTGKLFAKTFEKMLADAKQWNSENPDKEQIDVAALQSEMQENMKKIEVTLAPKKAITK